MRQKSEAPSEAAEKRGRDIKRATQRRFSADDKIRIVIAGLRGEDSIVEPVSNRTSITAGRRSSLKRGRSGAPAARVREATSDEVKTLRAQARQLKEALAEATATAQR